MSTDYRGIDYGRGKTNIDPTGIRFGVISQNEVLQAWADSSEPVVEFHCPHCGHEIESSDVEECPSCKKALTERDFQDTEASSYIYKKDGYEASCGESGDIFIMKSPYFTYAQYCSPCAPGACHLEHPLNDPDHYNRCYCFGADWFDDEKAPYDVYSIETGEKV